MARQPDEGSGGGAAAAPPAPELDAMGNDKRRPVVGRRYGADPRRRLLFYGLGLLALALVVLAFLTVLRGIDEREIPLRDTAPWSQTSAHPQPPRDVDFMRNGPTDTIPAREIFNRVERRSG